MNGLAPRGQKFPLRLDYEIDVGFVVPVYGAAP